MKNAVVTESTVSFGQVQFEQSKYVALFQLAGQWELDSSVHVCLRGYVKEYRSAQSGMGRKLGCLFLVSRQRKVGSVAVVQHWGAPGHLPALPEAHPSQASAHCFTVVLLATRRVSLHTCLPLTVTSCTHTLLMLHLCGTSSSWQRRVPGTALLTSCWLPGLSQCWSWHRLCPVSPFVSCLLR